MPELAEVETVRQQLNAFLPASVEKVLVRPSFGQLRKFSYQSIDAGAAMAPRLQSSSLLLKTNQEQNSRPQVYEWTDLCGYTFHPFSRFGKWLWASVTGVDISLFRSEPSIPVKDSEYYLIGHLGMSGQWLIKKGAHPPWDKHEHLRIRIKSPDVLWFCYRDPRRFGHVHFATFAEFAAWKNQYLVTIDPLDPEFSVDDVILACYQFAYRPVKSLLLDQNVFPGIGNYLASEILAHAGIHPLRPAGGLSCEELKKLYAAILKVLKISISQGGTSFDGAYVDSYGNPGGWYLKPPFERKALREITMKDASILPAFERFLSKSRELLCYQKQKK